MRDLTDKWILLVILIFMMAVASQMSQAQNNLVVTASPDIPVHCRVLVYILGHDYDGNETLTTDLVELEGNITEAFEGNDCIRVDLTKGMLKHKLTTRFNKYDQIRNLTDCTINVKSILGIK